MKSVKKSFNYGNFIFPVQREVDIMIGHVIASEIRKQIYNPSITNMRFTIDNHIRNEVYLDNIKYPKRILEIFEDL